MAEPELQILRGYELRLLRCAQPPTPSNSSATQSPPSDQIPTHHLHLLITDLLNSIETGDYLRALFSDSARLVFKLADNWPESLDDSADCAERVYSELVKRAESFMVEDCEDEKDKACRVIVVMCLAVAAFLWFTQCNMTGPLEGLPKRPVPFNVSKGEELVEWDNWARNQLMSAGSDLLGKLSNLQYIVFSKMLLLRAKDFLFEEESLSSTYGIRSMSWWLARLILFQQRILDERSCSLFDIVHVFINETVHHFGSLEKVTCYWGANLPREEASTIVSMVHLEAGIMEYSYGRVDSCRLHLESAEVDAGLQLSVTGILGFRTVHQVEPKAQLVLVANTATSNSGDSCTTLAPQIQTNDSSINQNNSDPHQCETSESSDILTTPKFLETGNQYGSREGIQNGHRTVASLKPIQQALILAKCLLIEKSGRHDEMQGWEMAPYIEAIDSQPSSYFIIRCFCDILRIRWESTRSRTKQRALLMMEKLVQCVDEPSLDVAQRIFFSFGVYMPTVPALRKEYGELLVSCGLIGEALKIFEDLELWDHLIYCYRILEKKAAAVELIKTQLSKMPTDPRLWCSLGDVTSNDSCYEKALEVSNNGSARAKRSLARSAYNRGDYEKSKILWESAMALNSLYPDGWYALGAAALKARDVEKALDAFTRAVQLDPENGEAWNNIACLHMMKKKSKEAFIAFKEALKFKRNSWQLWENYSQVALDVGSINQALEAMQRVLDMTSNKRIDAELLERIMLEIEGRASTSLSMSPPVSNNVNSDAQIHPDGCRMDSVYRTSTEFEVGKSQQETERLLELLGKILQQIVRSGSGADTWGIYARWLKIRGDLTMSSEALLKQVRSYQGSDLWKDEERFKKFAHASLELCNVYMEISSSTGSRRELLAAEMHLRNIIKQAGSFSATEEFRNLQACHDEVKVKLQSDAVPT